MNKKHQQQSCGCLLISLMAVGAVICAGVRIAQEIQKKSHKNASKIEQQQVSRYRIMPSNCR